MQPKSLLSERIHWEWKLSVNFLVNKKLWVSVSNMAQKDVKGFYSGSRETFQMKTKMREEIKSNENRNYVIESHFNLHFYF